MDAQDWLSTEAGRHLAGRVRRDTRPELLLRSAVHRQGLRFRNQRRLARGCTPDFVLVRQRLAVFVDGCFWHSCPTHGRTAFVGPNAVLWVEKMTRNRERDERANQLAALAGYRVIRLWECEVTRDSSAAARRVVNLASMVQPYQP